MNQGIGEEKPTWEAVRKALDAHAKELYGDDYVLQDFVTIGYVVSMGVDTNEEVAEYMLVTTTRTNHIIDGLVQQIELFNPTHHHDHDDD